MCEGKKNPKVKNSYTPSHTLWNRKINTGEFQLWRWLVCVTGYCCWAITSQNRMSDVTGFQGLIPIPITYSLGAMRVPGNLQPLTLNTAELRESRARADASRHCPRIKGLRAPVRAEPPAQLSWDQASMRNVSAGLGTTSPHLRGKVCCFGHSSILRVKSFQTAAGCQSAQRPGKLAD